MKNLVALASGIIFAFGLGIGGMLKPHVVIGFLDVFGDWNPKLIGVMLGSIAVNSLVWILTKKRHCDFQLPTKTDIDKQLILGAIIFGLGWGWVGICPGPSIVGLASGEQPFYIFVFFMLVGMKIAHRIQSK